MIRVQAFLQDSKEKRSTVKMSIGMKSQNGSKVGNNNVYKRFCKSVILVFYLKKVKFIEKLQ